MTVQILNKHYNGFVQTSTLDCNTCMTALTEFPSIQMGLEIAFKSLAAHDPFQIYPSAFTKGEDLNCNQWFDMDG